jgi:hypothetical protein
MSLRASSPADAQRLKALGYRGYVYPLDELLGVSRLPRSMTMGAMLKTAMEGCRAESYEDAEKRLREAGVAVNDDAVRAVTDALGAMVFENEREAAEEAFAAFSGGRWSHPIEKIPHALYLEVDGAAVPTRKKNAGKGARGSDGSGKKTKKEEKGSVWRENKLGMAFSTDHFLRWTDKHGNKQHRILKKDYVSYIGESKEFNKFMLLLALRNGYGSYRETVIISDGATWIRDMKDEYFPDAQHILDFWHLCENVSGFAKAVFKMEESKYKPWTDDICDLLKKSRHEEALSRIEGLGKRLLSGTSRNLAQYIKNNIDNIDYVSYMEKGYFIGSGAIESSNRTVVQRRVKQAGMRWNADSAQNVITLVAKIRSNRWEQDVVNAAYRHYGISPGRSFSWA